MGWRTGAAWLALGIGVGCSAGGGSVADAAADVAVDGGADVASGDVSPDETSAPVDVDDAAVGEEDGGPPPVCVVGEWTCSEDAYVLSRCIEGALGPEWEETPCLATHGQLCEEGACVDPWRYGAPVWSTCPDELQGTAETLVDKASRYDEIARRLHVHPELKWAMSVTLQRAEVPCGPDETPPCYGAEPATPEDEATWQDVERWWTGENDGLESGLYLASQAFRHAVTKSPEALDNLRLGLEGEVTRMRITGVPGVFTRQYVPPGVAGIKCPVEDKHYVTDIEKDDNRWVQVREDGCVWVVAHETMAWTKTDHCGLDDFAGYCWLDNVSQDEYAGHMFALGAIGLLVDEPDVSATARGLVEQVGVHLMEHDLTFVDWDGRVTEHGKLYATSFWDTPGFLAAQSMSFIQMAAELTQSAALDDFLSRCLLQTDGPGAHVCFPWPLEDGTPYPELLEQMALYIGFEGCKSNYNNFAMVMTFMHHLIWYARRPDLRERAQLVLDTEIMRAESERALIVHKNAWYDFMWAAQKRLGPGSDGPDYQAVEDAICSLKQFDASKHKPTKDCGALYPDYCEARLGGSEAEHPIPVAERCPRTFLWWNSPYSRHSCTERKWEVMQPGDYLLAYWMGRYYGFIPPDL